VRIACLSGAEARRRFADAGWLAAWRALVAAETRLALIQAPEFALPWYEAYGDAWEPLLVEGRDADGELVALMPLARRADGRLAHAGAEQAEYHGWLARAGRDAEFLPEACAALRAGPGFSAWKWRWLPPGTPVEALDGLAERGLELVREARPAPVWELAEEEHLTRLEASRSTRSKKNRYKKRGEFGLERVRDAERTQALLVELARQCDFRQEVVHGVRPFADDPRKARFFAARQRFPEANHFSVLWCGEEPLAFHFGAADGRTCLYGLTSYAPHEGKHSPGTLLVLELARQLRAEGFACLDLTPGSDPYKQRFATGTRLLTRIALYASRPAGLRARAALLARRAALGGDEEPDAARLQRAQRLQRGLREVRGELARRRLGGLARRAAGFVLERRELLCFATSAEPRAARPAHGETRLDAWAELAAYSRSTPYPSRRVLLSEALERFADGGRLCTASGPRGLARLAWRLAPPRGELAEALVRVGWLAPEGVLLRVSPPLDGRADEGSAGACVARLLAEDAGAAGVVVVEEAGPRERAELEALGLRVLGRARLRRVLRAKPAWQVLPLAGAEAGR
jgi:CelD/BcsL family acetyltransferase involved in cellulose biosynthesis